MYIFVDESGSFTQSQELNSWCVVAAYVAPEYQRRHIGALIAKVRAINGGAETKLKNLTETEYVWFLRELRKLEGIAFAVAVDIGLHRREKIEFHRDMQAEKIIEHRDKILNEAGRRGATNLSEQFRSLPAQLYTQLLCQALLFHRVICNSTLYFVQRHPPSLANFRWRIDQKAQAPTAYEKAFRTILPIFLQTESLSDPMIGIKGTDYRHFARFEYPPGTAPTYLKDTYGIEVEGLEGSPNIGKIIGEDFQLVNSAATPGIQVADLIASGMRRLLRGDFNAEDDVACALGSNFVRPLQDEQAADKTAVKLVSLDLAASVGKRADRLIRKIDAATRPIIAARKEMGRQSSFVHKRP